MNYQKTVDQLSRLPKENLGRYDIWLISEQLNSEFLFFKNKKLFTLKPKHEEQGRD